MRVRTFGLGLLLAATALHAGTQDLIEDLVFFDIRTGKPVELGPVNPQTVEGFELLYATPGTGDISEIAGHLLLRVKLNNNPGVPDNPRDLVVSFLADTEAGKPPRPSQPVVIQENCRKRNWFNLVNERPADESPFASLWQSLKGLSGGFNVIMDRQTMEHALKSYTVEQDRDLLRYRLNLTDKQKARLLAHLLHVRDHYEPPYFFFSQNCGSVLVQVIGEGIGHEGIAGFHPMVAPPHTLVGNLIREGVATPVIPSFYSYRKEGFIAREIFNEVYANLRLQVPELDWPEAKGFHHRNELRRAEAVEWLRVTAGLRPDLHEQLFRLAALFQEAEMVFMHKGLNCEEYTTVSTAVARKLQREVLQARNAPIPVDTLELARSAFGPVEQTGFDTGTPHTGHYGWSVGGGSLEGDAVLTLGGSLLKQEMGSTSSIAMQRGSAVELGGFSLAANASGIREWNITGLSLQKFRDTLRRVTPVTQGPRGLGLGLSVLNFRHREMAPETHGEVAGAAILANLASSDNHDDYVLASFGVDIGWSDYPEETNFALELPFRVESLLTVERWQWRSTGEYRLTTRSTHSDEMHLTTSLAYRLGEVGGSELKLRMEVDHQTVFKGELVPGREDRLLARLAVEIRGW